MTMLGYVSTLSRYSPEGEVNFDFTRSIPEGLIFTRDTSGCYFDANGYPRIVGPNVPMFEAGGLLLDGANTNFIPYSEWDSGTSGWGLTSGLTFDGTHKFGDITLARVRETPTTNTRIISGGRLGFSMPFVANRPVCVSVFSRIAPGSLSNSRYLVFGFSGLYDDGTDIAWRAYFRPYNGNFTSGFLASGETAQGKVDDLADGVRRLAMEFTPLNPGTITGMSVYYASSSSSIASFAGDGVSGVDIGGWQLSQGIKTLYIRSGDSSTTRGADGVEGPVSGILAPNGQGGTILVDLDVDGFASTWTQPVVFRTDAMGTNVAYLNMSTSNTLKWQTPDINFSGGPIAAFPGPVKSAFRLRPSDMYSYVNGSVNGSTSGTFSILNPKNLILQAQGYRRFRIRHIRSTFEVPTGVLEGMTKV